MVSKSNGRLGEWEKKYIDELAGVVYGGFLADLVHDLRFGVC